MDPQRRLQATYNPENHANIFSKLFFCWLNKLIWHGFRKDLEGSDIYGIQKKDGCKKNGVTLEQKWSAEVKTRGNNASLYRVLWNIHGYQFLALGILSCSEEAARTLQPLFLGQLIRYFFSDSDVTTLSAYLYALGISLCVCYSATIRQIYKYSVLRITMRMRIAVSALLYRKALRLNAASLHKDDMNLTNLLTNDVGKFDHWSMPYLHHVWIGPLQAVTVLYILWHMYGTPSLVGIVTLFLFVPLIMALSYASGSMRRVISDASSKRVSLIEEILSGIRIIKLYCWENFMMKKYRECRKKEMSLITRAQCLRALSLSPSFNANQIIVFSLVLCYLLLSEPGTKVDTVRLFVTMALINPLWRTWTLIMPTTLLAFKEIWESFAKVREYLLFEDYERRTNSNDDDNYAVSVNMTSASWTETQAKPTLSNVEFSVAKGELLLIVGQNNSGKTSLLLSLLSEMPFSGDVNVNGKVAYVAQTPWIFDGTVRENILCGRLYDDVRYQAAVDAADLQKDLDAFSNSGSRGDEKKVGPNGANLSGGQRTRVALARAFYADADIYLLDDPLSSVDPDVRGTLFHSCTSGFLQEKGKTILLVTQQLQYIEDHHTVLYLHEGKQKVIGKKGAINDASFTQFVVESRTQAKNKKSVKSRHNRNAAQKLKDEGGSLDESNDNDEEVHQGSIGFKIYFRFLWVGTGCVGLFLLFLFNFLAQGSFVATDRFLSWWSEMQQQSPVTNYTSMQTTGLPDTILNTTLLSTSSMSELPLTTLSPANNSSYNTVHQTTVTESSMTTVSLPITYHDSFPAFLSGLNSSTYIYIYAALVGCTFILGCCQALVMYMLVLRSSASIHRTMARSVIQSPARWFYENPVGRIVNRFSKDSGMCDEKLPNELYEFVKFTLMNLSTVALACYFNPWVLIPTVPLFVALILLTMVYLTTARHTRRLESRDRSPVLSHAKMSQTGVHTIRASQLEQRITSAFYVHLDNHTDTHVACIAMEQWFSARVEWICALFITATAMFSVYASNSMSPGLVGLTMVYAMNLMGLVQHGIALTAQVEQDMVATERIMEYGDLQPEQDFQPSSSNGAPESWPEKGTIEVKQASLTYVYGRNHQHTALKDISFTVKPGEKIGIVGRTGAGKSSIVAMLTRLTQPDGYIRIDGVDITTMSLHKLRSAIAVIPQEVVIFVDTIWNNLDPVHRDEENFWNALEKVDMKVAILNLEERLDTELGGEGHNFSAGQQQKLCLCRAILKLLRGCKILIMDEATAKIDHQSDVALQHALRDAFPHCTILTIAHYYETIQRSDRVMEIDNGNIRAFDTPKQLLEDPNSFLTSMRQEVGDETDNELGKARPGTSTGGPTTAQGTKALVNSTPHSTDLNDNSNPSSYTRQDEERDDEGKPLVTSPV